MYACCDIIMRCVRNVMTSALFVTFVLQATARSDTGTTSSVYERPSAEAANCLCKFQKHNSPVAALDKIKPLCGKRYEVQDHDGTYAFNVGICVSGQISPRPDLAQSGAIQKHLKGIGVNDSEIHSMGSIEQAEVMSGNNWVILEYEGGARFNHHCNGENRRTVIMIMCKEGESVGKLRWVEENSDKSSDCYYLFELDHQAACSVAPDSGLSIGSIVCIVLLVVIGVYLIVGVLYMRLVKGAKGLNQIPNYSFWRDFGALQSDGCNLICRCGGQKDESKYYHELAIIRLNVPQIMTKLTNICYQCSFLVHKAL